MIAAITSFDISRNPGIAAKLDQYGQVQQADCNLTELKQLLDAIEQLEKLQNLNIGEIGTGPEGGALTTTLMRSKSLR